MQQMPALDWTAASAGEPTPTPEGQQGSAAEGGGSQYGAACGTPSTVVSPVPFATRLPRPQE